MERNTPNYNDPDFKNPDDSSWNKFDRGVDKTLDKVNTVYGVGRKIGYIFMGLFFFLIGGSLLVWGIFNYTDRVKSLESYEKTMGTVVEMKEVPPTDNSGVTYQPVIQFKDLSGREFKFKSNHSSDPPEYKVGERVEIFYDKSNPDEAFVNSFLGKWGGSIILFICPLVLFPVGIWMLFSAFRRTKTSAYTRANTGSGSVMSAG